MQNTLKSVLLVLGVSLSLNAYAQQPTSGQLTFSTEEKVEATLYWENGPIANSESVLRIEFTDAITHQPTALTSALDVVPRMQMGTMGHGTSPVTLTKITDQHGNEIIGQYRVSRIFFVMSGIWKMKFNLTHPDHTIETQVWNVQVPNPSVN